MPVRPGGLRLGGMLFLALKLLSGAGLQADPVSSASGATVLIVVGAQGAEDYGKEFATSTDHWIKASEQGGAHSLVIGLGPTNETSDLVLLQQAITNEPVQGPKELWLVLVGHGTFDGKDAKFNLRGPDLSITNLAEWLKPFTRPMAIVDCSSSSAPFLHALSGPNRVIVTATRSGYEQNYSRFGPYLSEAIADPKADLDKDGQTSLLEAFLSASRRVSEFYESEGRLATEHSLIDDNGDGLGTPADWFRGVRATKTAKGGATTDGARAHQFHLVRSESEQNLDPAVRAKRDELEVSLQRLRETKAKLPEDEYYRQLETLLVGIAKLSATSGK